MKKESELNILTCSIGLNDLFSRLHDTANNIDTKIKRNWIFLVATAIVFELIRGAGVKTMPVPVSGIPNLNPDVDYKFILCFLPFLFSLFYYNYATNIKNICEINKTITTTYTKYASDLVKTNIYRFLSSHYFYEYNSTSNHLHSLTKYFLSFLPPLYFTINTIIICIGYYETRFHYNCDWQQLYIGNETFSIHYSVSWFLCSMRKIQFYPFLASTIFGAAIVAISTLRIIRTLILPDR